LNPPTQDALRSALDALGARRVECCVADFTSNARGKTVGREDFLAAGGCRMASVVLGMTLTAQSPPGVLGQILPGSYQDIELRADPQTLLEQVGRPHAATVLCEPYGRLRAEASGREFDANELSPRAALRRVVARLAGAGLRALVAPELEFYLLNRRPGGAPHELTAARASPGSPAHELGCEADSVERAGHFAPYFDDLFDVCERMRIPATGYAHESSYSQYEVNFRPGAPLDQADAVFRFKRVARQVAARHGYLASFIAKPFLDQPGCGMHWHFSLQQTADGRNAFLAADGRDGPRLRQFVAGLQRHAAAATALFAPYDNSYDRIVRSDASPSRASWGVDDRTVAFRIPASGANNRRIENRLPGGDASPYLIVAATLGLGLAGIENGWEPEPEAAGLPRTLGQALDHLQADQAVRAALGPVLVDLFCTVKRGESALRNACPQPREGWDLVHLPEQA
jgi:glutamine synthetase